MGLVKGWLNGSSKCYTLHPVTQPLSGGLEMSCMHRTPRRRECFSLRERKISLCVSFSQENNRKAGMTVKGDWHFIESQSPARCCYGFRVKSWGRTPEGVWHASPGVWRCLWTEAGVFLSPGTSCVAGATWGGDWGEQCVERGQQMPDTSCRPGGLLGGNHWVFLKELPCMCRLPSRHGTPAERGCGRTTGRNWERWARGPVACLSSMEDPETGSHWRDLAFGL